MSNKPFNETARNLKLDEAAEENDDYILCGELQNDEGEWVSAEIDLNQVFGASQSSGQVEWGGKDFSKSADCVEFSVNPIPVPTSEDDIHGQLQERPMLSVTIQPDWGNEQVEACVDLSDGIVNNNGQFEFRLDRVPQDQRIVKAY
ncbi:Cyanovirin-N [Aspergillus novoparasiticus]|uniref:Cyanovirin-N n=1 Tax=Aspergillus novoparasiticus TaxID=986946 RepID=A0A5N6EM13_9EURO|nr:Cyanovirin-N [Aspergillus novoparasiticus]